MHKIKKAPIPEGTSALCIEILPMAMENNNSSGGFNRSLDNNLSHYNHLRVTIGGTNQF